VTCVHERCSTSCTLGELRAHKKKCGYRPLACHSSGCDFTGSPAQIVEHQQQVHTKEVIKVGRASSYNRNFWVAAGVDTLEKWGMLLSWSGKHFFFNVAPHLNAKETQQTFQVCHIGQGSDLGTCRLTLTVSGGPMSGDRAWTGVPASYRHCRSLTVTLVVESCDLFNEAKNQQYFSVNIKFSSS
jgi:hypothetical protein